MEYSKIEITLGQLDHSTEKHSKYWVPIIKNNELIESNALFVDKEILPKPYEKIIHVRETGKGFVNIKVFDAREFPEYKKWFDLSKLKEPEDLFSKFKDSSLFKPIKN